MLAFSTSLCKVLEKSWQRYDHTCFLLYFFCSIQNPRIFSLEGFKTYREIRLENLFIFQKNSEHISVIRDERRGVNFAFYTLFQKYIFCQKIEFWQNFTLGHWIFAPKLNVSYFKTESNNWIFVPKI